MKRTLSRRDFLRASAATVGVIGLAACAPAAAPGGGEGADAAETVIEVYLGETFQPDVARGEGLQPLHEAPALADEWEEIQSGCHRLYRGPGR